MLLYKTLSSDEFHYEFGRKYGNAASKSDPEKVSVKESKDDSSDQRDDS